MATDFTYNNLNKRPYFNLTGLATIIRMHIIESCVTLQAQYFEKLLQEAQANWPPLAYTSSQLDKQCFTLIMRPSEESRELLAERLRSVAERFPDNIYYGEKNLHLTVFGLPNLDSSPLVHRHFDRYLSSHVCAVKPVTLPLGGLSIVGNTLVFKAFDPIGNLLQFNKSAVIELTEELYGDGVDFTKMIGLHTEIFWLTAARLGPNQPREFLDYVVEHGNESLGALSFETMELIKTDHLFRPENTKVIKAYTLGELN